MQRQGIGASALPCAAVGGWVIRTLTALLASGGGGPALLS
jgi:hypothetical protein